jgi:mycothiol conjugate amidase Mca
MTAETGLTLMAVFGHPDDEVFGSGGVLARAAYEGMRTVLVTATRGEEGEIVDPTLDQKKSRHNLAAIREEEERRAATILGIHEVRFLGYRDSGMPGTPANENPYNFQNADREDALGKVVRLVRELRPDVLLTFDAHGGYGHPDHIRAYEVTLAAFEAAADPARFPELGPAPWQVRKLYSLAFSRASFRRFAELIREYGLPDPFGEGHGIDLEHFLPAEASITTRVDVRRYVQQKQAALRAYRTQVAADHPMLALPDEAAREIMGMETFTRLRSLVDVPLPEDDLFAGLRGGAASERGEARVFSGVR